MRSLLKPALLIPALLLLLTFTGLAKDKKKDDPRNQYTAVYPVKFFCNAVGADRDVIIYETNDPRFTQLRTYLSTIFKPYPRPDTWIEEETQIAAGDRINYEFDAEPYRRLESWYFIHGEFLTAPYTFKSTEGTPQVDSALALLRSMEQDSTLKDLNIVRWAVSMDALALGIYNGNISGAASFLKGYQYPDYSGSAGWNWLYRALTRYEYYTRKDEKIDTVFCQTAAGKPTKVGPLTIAPVAFIPQPFLSIRYSSDVEQQTGRVRCHRHAGRQVLGAGDKQRRLSVCLLGRRSVRTGD
jgi:hypothetical protein